MRKKMLLFVVISAMVGVMLGGCGAKDETADAKATTGVLEEREDTENIEGVTPNDENKEKEPESEMVDISKQTAKEVVLNIYGTDVPLVSTKEQIVEIGKKAGWTFYVDQEIIVAEFGDASVTFQLKDSADDSALKEVYGIQFDSEVDWNKVKVYGMDAKSYVDNYEMNTSFYKDVNEEVRVDIFQYSFTISVYGDRTLTKIPDEEFRRETYGYDKVDYTVYGEDEYVNDVIRNIAGCKELMELDHFYRNEIVCDIFQDLKLFEFGEMVMIGLQIDGSTVITLLCEDDKNYSLHLKHNFTGDTVYIRDEYEVMEAIAEAEWDAIHDMGYDIITEYDLVVNHMGTACNKLLKKGLITEYEIHLDLLTVKTARGIEYQYRLGNPSVYEINQMVFENINTPNEEYNERRGR